MKVWVDHMGSQIKDGKYDIPLMIATGLGFFEWYSLFTSNPMPISEYLLELDASYIGLLGLLTFVPEGLSMMWVIIALPMLIMKGLSAFKND